MCNKIMPAVAAVVTWLFSPYAAAAAVYGFAIEDFSIVARMSAENILGEPDGEWVEFGGVPAFVTVAFERAFVDVPGDELQVVVRNWDVKEGFTVSASEDGVSFFEVTTFDPATFPGHNQHNPPDFNTLLADLGASGLTEAQYVRLEALTPLENLPEYDSVGVIQPHAIPLPAGAWLLGTGIIGIAAWRRAFGA